MKIFVIIHVPLVFIEMEDMQNTFLYKTINSKNEDPVSKVMELTNKKGADAVIDFVNASKTVETDMQLLRKRAEVVLVGLFGGEIKLNLVSMPTRAYSI